MNKDKFQILRDFAKSNEKPDKTIYEYVKEVLDMNSAYAKENQELKNLNRIYEEIISDDKENYKLLSSEIKELKNQQKEFIDWLEDKEKQFDIMGDPINSGACLGILRKYKEIIGDKSGK